jgi:hypothetical protein
LARCDRPVRPSVVRAGRVLDLMYRSVVRQNRSAAVPVRKPFRVV